MLIERILGEKTEPRFSSLPEDAVFLDFEEVQKRIVRKTSAAGRDVAIRLAAGVLFDGAVLAVSEGEAITLRIEKAHVIAFSPKSAAEGVRFAYEVGNRHAPLYAADGIFLVPFDAHLFAALRGEGLYAYFSYAFPYSDLLPVRLAHEAAADADLERLLVLEERLFAARVPREQREAASRLGSRLQKTAQAAGIVCDTFFAEYARRAGSLLPHPVCYGVLTARLSIAREAVLERYAYAQLSALVNTCVKLVPLAQTEGQRILAALAPVWEGAVACAEKAGEEDLMRAAPALAVRAIEHESLYSRLYMS